MNKYFFSMVMVFLAAIFIVAFHRNKLISMNYLDASVEVSKDDPPVTFGDIPLTKGDKIEKPFYRRWYRLPHLIRTEGILPRSKLRGILGLKQNAVTMELWSMVPVITFTESDAAVSAPPPKGGNAPYKITSQPGTPLSSTAPDSQVSASSIINAREIPPDIAQKYTPGKFIPRTVKNEAFGVGENLVFSIDYGFYSAGIATMAILDSAVIQRGMCYHIRTTAESNKFISSFYRVRDRVDSYIDIQGIFSRRFEKRLREGGYSFDELVDVHQDRLLAVSTKDKRAFMEIPLYVQDILSSLYYIRTFDLKVGKKETIEVYADGKVYPLQIVVHKKEKITVEAGTFNCFLIEPILKSAGIFSQKGKLFIWLSDDKSKIPVKMTSKVTIGNIAANLKNYKKQVDK